MPEALHIAARCPQCGAELEAEGAACQQCSPEAVGPAAPSPIAVEKLHETDEERWSLKARILAALVYLCAGGFSIYFSIPFFQNGDWWFGLMGVGLAIIALIGVKESFFPSEWRPE